MSFGILNIKGIAVRAPPPLSCESALVLPKAEVCCLPSGVPGAALLWVLLWLCGDSSYCKVSDPLPGRVTLRLWRAPCSQMTA